MAERFIFDLTKTEGTDTLEAESNLFEPEVQTVLGWLKTHLEKIENRAKHPYHQHGGILLSGERGAGKSTFLQILASRVKNHDALKSKVHILPVLDPTLIDGDDIFLASITASIWKAVKEHLERSHRHSGKSHTPNTDLKQTLEQLAPAMRVLDEGARRHVMQSAVENTHLFGERLMGLALTGMDLQEKFSKFVEEAAKVLEVKFFLLFLDDVDTDFSSGYQVLETVRRNMVDGRILPVLSGDYELFRLVVREKVWKDLRGLAEREKEEAGPKGELYKQVRNLEGQYLLKLVRPEHRLMLPAPLKKLEVLNKDKEKEFLIKWGEGKEISFNKLIERANKYIWGIKEGTTNNPAYSLLTNNTRQIRAALYWLAHHEDIITDLPKEISNAERALQILRLNVNVQEISNDILLSTAEGKFLPLTQWLCDRMKWEDLYRLDVEQLKGSVENDSVVFAVLALQASLYHTFAQDRFSVLRYVGHVLVPALARAQASEIPQSWGLNNIKQPAWMTSAKVTAWLFAEANHQKNEKKTNRNQLFNGFGVKMTGPWGIKNTTDITPTTNINSDGLPKWLGLMANETDKYPSQAVWRKNAGPEAVAILDWFTTSFQKSSTGFKVVEPWAAISALGDLSEQRTFSHILSARRSTFIPIDIDNIDISADLDEEETDAPDTNTNPLEIVIAEWIKHKPAHIKHAHTTILADAASRFRKNQTAIYNASLKPADLCIGAMLQRWTLAWLNAVLYEEATALGILSLSELNMISVNVDHSQLSRNINKCTSISPEKFPLFFYYATCPILYATLDEDWLKQLHPKLQPLPFKIDHIKSTYKDLNSLTSLHTLLCGLMPFGEEPQRSASSTSSSSNQRSASSTSSGSPQRSASSVSAESKAITAQNTPIVEPPNDIDQTSFSHKLVVNFIDNIETISKIKFNKSSSEENTKFISDSLSRLIKFLSSNTFSDSFSPFDPWRTKELEQLFDLRSKYTKSTSQYKSEPILRHFKEITKSAEFINIKYIAQTTKK